MDRIREASWTGSESARREQGACEPPKRPPLIVPRYALPAGTPCLVGRVESPGWRRHVTREPLGFERYESYRNGEYTFRHKGYLIRVARGKVAHREDAY